MISGLRYDWSFAEWKLGHWRSSQSRLAEAAEEGRLAGVVGRKRVQFLAELGVAALPLGQVPQVEQQADGLVVLPGRPPSAGRH